jgi:starvation-inducible DNA-binding protein
MNKTTTAARSGSFGNHAVTEISEALRQLLADVFCLYLKTKNFHWHMTGSHFRDYHLLLDEQADQVFAMTDLIADAGGRSEAAHSGR